MPSGRSGVRVDVAGRGSATVDTGLPLFDRLLERLAAAARFDLALEVEPGDVEAAVITAGSSLGSALAGPLRADGALGYGSGVMVSAEAIAHVVLEVAADDPLVVSNVDLTEARIGGLGTDVVRTFLERVADSAGIVLHVRLLNGTNSQHVLEAIFKALGVALSQACTSPSKGEASG